MQIPTHQMHNVLKRYSKQLALRNRTEGVEIKEAGPLNEPQNRAVNGKRQTIIDRVTADVLNRISSFGSEPNMAPPRMEQEADRSSAANKDPSPREGQFVFHTMDTDNRKKPRTLPQSGARFLMKRLDELVKLAVTKTSEPSEE